MSIYTQYIRLKIYECYKYELNKNNRINICSLKIYGEEYDKLSLKLIDYHIESDNSNNNENIIDKETGSNVLEIESHLKENSKFFNIINQIILEGVKIRKLKNDKSIKPGNNYTKYELKQAINKRDELFKVFYYILDYYERN